MKKLTEEWLKAAKDDLDQQNHQKNSENNEP